MQTAVTIRDEVWFAPQGEDRVMTLNFAEPRISARELIRARVIQEVEAFNADRSRRFRGWFQSDRREQRLNGKKSERQPVAWEAEYEKALDAFRGNQFILLINEHQVTDLDEMIELGPQVRATFLKLLPLVGG